MLLTGLVLQACLLSLLVMKSKAVAQYWTRYQIENCILICCMCPCCALRSECNMQDDRMYKRPLHSSQTQPETAFCTDSEPAISFSTRQHSASEVGQHLTSVTESWHN